MKEIVYMEQPPGFKDPNFLDGVCKLNRFLYGLKQAPRAWFERLLQFILHLWFVCSKADPSLFILKNGSLTILMLVCVDDALITGNDDKFIGNLVQKLRICLKRSRQITLFSWGRNQVL